MNIFVEQSILSFYVIRLKLVEGIFNTLLFWMCINLLLLLGHFIFKRLLYNKYLIIFIYYIRILCT